jgi:NADH:ubiquinone oxidoreductase subunit 4 (subunit M)
LSTDPWWLACLALLASATALLASLAALGERTWRAWLGHVGLAQVAFALVGFAEASPAGAAAGWSLLASAAGVTLLIGLGCLAASRWTRVDDLPRLDPAAIGSGPALATTLGYLAAGAVPGVAGFAGRQTLIASLLDRGSPVDLVSGLGVLFATAALSAGIWRQLIGSTPALRPAVTSDAAIRTSRLGRTPARVGVPPTGEPTRRAPRAASPRLEGSARLALAAASSLTVGLGVVPADWLAALAGATSARPTALASLAAAILVGGAALFGLAGVSARSALPPLVKSGKHALRPALALEKRYGVSRALDPYLVAAALVLALGRLSAALVDNTLGRLVRS